ncbi:MAG TPA: peptide chain release factor 2 [Oligoflexia bacterium]|nr:peptide chain release factor 2 [Oligoflexia bacterium]
MSQIGQSSEIREGLKAIGEKLGFLRGSLDIANKERRLNEIADLSTQAEFWADNRKAQSILKEKGRLENELGTFKKSYRDYEDLNALFELAEESGDESLYADARAQLTLLFGSVENIELQKMLSGEQDGLNAIVSINAGAGGTESQDWAQMLLRMYLRWAQQSGYKTEVVDIIEGEQAGIKSATVIISGVNAFGFLKSEIGIHRLVRISPFDSNARRHPSFASVFVTPEVDDNFEVEIRDVDLRVDVYRAGGKGGQGVNTTDSAVRLTHFPTGIVVQCQNERSQIKNKAMAMKILKSRIYERHMEEERKKAAEVEAGKKDIAWGSQIRSYVLHPYKMVKDHRTGFVSSQAEKVLDGDLDGHIKSYLRCSLTGEWARGGDSDID